MNPQPTRRDFLATSLSATLALTAPGSLLALPSETTLADDPRRPQYHLLPARNWMNDPNAPIFWKGNYHLFFQYNPHAAVWGDMHWAHAISPDTVHWRHLPIALAPTPGGPDAQGCFSGTAIPDGDKVVVLYTGVVTSTSSDATLKDAHNSFRESQCLAASASPDLTVWQKDPTPVLPTPPPGLDITGFRDPSIWRQGGAWYMAVGSGIRGQGGAILLYRSSDLHHWTYEHILTSGKMDPHATPNPVDSGEMWECPDLFPLGNKHVLIYSTRGQSLWQSGTLDSATMLFHPEQHGILDHGSFYAPKTQRDAHGNRILWGWIPETRPEARYSAAGWAGMMSLPRILSLDSTNRLRITPSPALQILRAAPIHPTSSTARSTGPDGTPGPRSRTNAGDQIVVLPAATGELLLEAHSLTAPFQLTLVLEARDNSTQPPIATLTYNPTTGQLTLDNNTLPLNHPEPSAPANPSNAAPTPQPLTVHIFLDGSVAEIFVNNATALTKRFYYPGPTAPNIIAHLTTPTGPHTLQAWHLRPISPNRLT